MTRRGPGEGSIRERKDGTFEARLVVDGKRLSFYGETRREVQQKLREAKRQAEQGKLIGQSRQTVAQYLEGWLTDHVSLSRRPKTIESYALNIQRLVPHLGHLRLDRLKSAHIQQAYAQLLASGLSARSVEQAHAVLRCALQQAVREGILPYSPVAAVTPPHPERHEPDPLTPEEIEQLFSVTTEDRLHALWVLLITTGLRLGEASGLTWEQLNLEEGTFQIRQAVQRQNRKGLVKVPVKTERSRRPLYLSASPIKTLCTHRERQQREYAEAGMTWSHKVLVFSTATGDPLDPGHIRHALHRALAQIGREAIRVHDLRHTCASYYLLRDTHPKKVQELLGHSTITLTLNTYSHLIPGTHREIADLVEDLFPSYTKEGKGEDRGEQSQDRTLAGTVSTPSNTP
jgi:integrase